MEHRSLHAEVVIVGAGPGGSAAAISLAQRGIRDVLLLDKDRFPRDKTCGSAISPAGLEVLDELGAGALVRRLGYPIRALRIVTPGEREMYFAGAGEGGIVLLRKDLDNLLVERAAALGVTFRPAFHVRELLREQGRVVGVRGKDGEEIRARHVICADGAASAFSVDPRPRRTISTVMGWWEGAFFAPHTIEMIFDKHLLPLYGWLFPESAERVNIGICVDAQRPHANLRDVFQRFLDDHFRLRLLFARPIGRLKGHPIVTTTWIGHGHAPGVVYLGEAARITHPATGEGIYQAMESGALSARAIAAIHEGRQPEEAAMRAFVWACRRRFSGSFLMGQIARGVVQTPLVEGIAMLYNHPRIRGALARITALRSSGS